MWRSTIFDSRHLWCAVDELGAINDICVVEHAFFQTDDNELKRMKMDQLKSMHFFLDDKANIAY
jgi:hypothetical protein